MVCTRRRFAPANRRSASDVAGTGNLVTPLGETYVMVTVILVIVLIVVLLAVAGLSAQLTRVSQQMAAGGTVPQPTGLPTPVAIDPTLSNAVAGLGGQMQQLAQLVQQIQTNTTTGFTSVNTTLQHHADVTATLQRTANGLQEALANTNARGQWGERMADDILAASGLVAGVNYVKRTALAGEARGIPDFTFLLPDQHVMFMDVKFPIDGYLAYLQATTDLERSQHLDAFLKAVRGHVRVLAKRDYVANDDRPAVDNVLMFVPNESIVSFIHQHAPTLVDEAMSEHVVLCSPLNLFVFLGVVRQAFDSFRIEHTSRQMLALIGRFGKEWQNYVTQVDKVRKQFTTVATSFDALATTRRRALERPLRELDELRREEHVEVEAGWTTALADEFDALPAAEPDDLA